MKTIEAILEIISVCFLGLGFIVAVAGKTGLCILCFILFALLGLICVWLEDEKERKIFKK